MHLIGWEQISQWKSLTKSLMKCPPGNIKRTITAIHQMKKRENIEFWFITLISWIWNNQQDLPIATKLQLFRWQTYLTPRQTKSWNLPSLPTVWAYLLIWWRVKQNVLLARFSCLELNLPSSSWSRLSRYRATFSANGWNWWNSGLTYSVWVAHFVFSKYSEILLNSSIWICQVAKAKLLRLVFLLCCAASDTIL